jgi:hypothetical protein
LTTKVVVVAPATTASQVGAVPTKAAPPVVAGNAVTPTPLPVSSKGAGLPLLALPKDCDYLSLDGKTTAVVLCRPPEDSFWVKFGKDSPALIMSLIAVLVSIYAFYVSSRQQKFGIKRSIQDDYWLRTLVSPVCIVPLLDLRKHIMETLPAQGVTPNELKAYSVNSSARFSQMDSALGNLGIVSGDLVGEARTRLGFAEDEVSNYIALLGLHVGDPVANVLPDILSSREAISAKIFDVLKPIQDHQLNGVEFGRPNWVVRCFRWLMTVVRR